MRDQLLPRSEWFRRRWSHTGNHSVDRDCQRPSNLVAEPGRVRGYVYISDGSVPFEEKLEVAK